MAPNVNFTYPERELMKHMLKGLTAEEIAKSTNTDIKLVCIIRHNILKKLGVKNQLEFQAKMYIRLQEKYEALESQLKKEEKAA